MRNRFSSAIGCNVTGFQRGSVIAHVSILLEEVGLSERDVLLFIYDVMEPDGRLVSLDALDVLNVDNSSTSGKSSH